MPEASQPRISETVIRIPRMIGWPPRLPGSIVMISRYDAILLASPVYLVVPEKHPFGIFDDHFS
ncbi:MAG: hypothetical protein WCJ40_21810, partial [Planctomycetota bacterium]